MAVVVVDHLFAGTRPVGDSGHSVAGVDLVS